jgi:hypothetical protein
MRVNYISGPRVKALLRAAAEEMAVNFKVETLILKWQNSIYNSHMDINK